MLWVLFWFCVYPVRPWRFFPMPKSIGLHFGLSLFPQLRIVSMLKMPSLSQYGLNTQLRASERAEIRTGTSGEHGFLSKHTRKDGWMESSVLPYYSRWVRVAGFLFTGVITIMPATYAPYMSVREMSRSLLQSDRHDTSEFVTSRRKYAITDTYQLDITQR